MRYPRISIGIYTYASLEGWVTSMDNASTGKVWLPDEKLMRINVLELMAVLLALKSFAKKSHKHIKIISDNTTAIHRINKTSYHIIEIHYQVLKIWKWAIIHKNHLSSAHNSEKLTTVVVMESWSNHVDTKWMFQSKLLNLALEYKNQK